MMKSIICICSAIFFFAFVIEISNAQPPIPNPPVDFEAHAIINATAKVRVWFSYTNQSSLFKTAGQSTELSICGSPLGDSIMSWNDHQMNCSISCIHGSGCSNGNNSIGCACGINNIWGWLEESTWQGNCNSQTNTSVQGNLFSTPWTNFSQPIQGCFIGDTPLWFSAPQASVVFSRYEALKNLNHFNIPETCSCPSEGSSDFFESEDYFGSEDLTSELLKVAFMQAPIKFYQQKL